MMAKYILLLILSFSNSFFAESSINHSFKRNLNTEIALNSWKYNSGDSIIWAGNNYNDSSWQTIIWHDNLNTKPGVHWYRCVVELKGAMKDYDNLMLTVINLPNAFEVYWDGKLIGTNGKVGEHSSAEVLGYSFKHIYLTKEMTKDGAHLIAIRSSNFKRFLHTEFSRIIFGYKNARDAVILRLLNRSALYIGGYFIAFLFTLMLYIGNNRYKSYLFLMIAFLLILIFRINNYLVVAHHLPIILYNLLVFSQKWILFAQSIVFIGFVLYHFELPLKLMHLVIYIFISFLSQYFNILFPAIGLHAINAIETVYTIGLLIYAVQNKKPGGNILLFGYLILLLQYLYLFGYAKIPSLRVVDPNISFIISLGVFWSCLILSVSIKIRERNKYFEELKLRSLRLETDLLKKSIQPHFIMNTLSSIKSLARRKPEEADNLIQALASEFRILIQILKEKEIGIYQEIELCKYHLKIMGYRWNSKYEMIVDDYCCDFKVPPLIFHTLIENGITHSFKPREDGTFWLSFEKNENCCTYTLRNNGSMLADIVNDRSINIEEGMGIKYIKTRLEESYPGKWKLDYGLKNSCWEVAIKISK